MDREPQQMIQVGDQLIPLPPGVTAAEWALERLRWQNPRIRAFLGCIRLLQGVLESNYAILHCSPERLFDIWGKVRKVAELLRVQIGPLLAAPSRIPELEVARRGAELSLAILEDQVLSRLDRMPAELPDDRVLELRKLLCISIGQIHSYLQDTFGELMAADPRSLHDADYFLSRRFPRDIEEAEWLHSTVARLQEFLHEMMRARPVGFEDLLRDLRTHHRLPGDDTWKDVHRFLQRLLEGLVPKLHEVLALRGIRFDEMEVLDRYANEVPARCETLTALYEAARETLDRIASEVGETMAEREQAERDRAGCHQAFSRRLSSLLDEVDQSLRDLVAFVPLWLGNIEKRRALMFQRLERMGNGHPGADGDSGDGIDGDPLDDEALDGDAWDGDPFGRSLESS